MSSNSRLRAGQSFFQRSNKKASKIYGGASDVGSKSIGGQARQGLPSSRSNRDRYGGFAGGSGQFGSKARDPYGIKAGQQTRNTGTRSTGISFGHAAAKPATAGALGSTPQRKLGGQMRIGLSQNRIKIPGGELMSEEVGHGLVKGVNKTHGRLQNQTLSNFGAHAGSQAADGIKPTHIAAARARSRPAAFGQKR